MEIELIKKDFGDKLDALNELKHLDDLRIEYFGKKGILTQELKNIGTLPPEERSLRGKNLNELKNILNKTLQDKNNLILDEIMTNSIEKEKIDVTLPGRWKTIGTKHIVEQVISRIEEIFISMGFTVEEGPEIETCYYNFEALNIPDYHPARDEHDTFFFDPEHILRTQTSPVQIRTMETMKPPVRIIAPGKCYRSDDIDPSHLPMFHQIEGLYIDEGVTFADLKATLELFLTELFRKKVKLRFRPSYFPFTEPSAEVDVNCIICDGKGCRVCSNKGWLEILGCGMVDPEVYKKVGYDSEKYTGWAFGIGVERIAMQLSGIPDIRYFYENDKRFLCQY